MGTNWVASAAGPQRLDLVKLRWRLGPDHSILHGDLAPKLKCFNAAAKKSA